MEKIRILVHFRSKTITLIQGAHVFQNYKKGKKICATNKTSLKMLKYASKRHMSKKKY